MGRTGRVLTAGLIIRDNRLLLIHNIKHGRIRIEPPGGKRRARESDIESVVREASEELGIKVGRLRFFGVYDTHSPEGEFPVRMYLCEVVSGEPGVLEPDKHSAFGWYSYEELERLKEEGSLVPNMVEALGDLKRHLT